MLKQDTSLFQITFSEPTVKKNLLPQNGLGLLQGLTFPQAKGNALPSVTLKKKLSKAASLALTKEALFCLTGGLK